MMKPLNGEIKIFYFFYSYDKMIKLRPYKTNKILLKKNNLLKKLEGYNKDKEWLNLKFFIVL